MLALPKKVVCAIEAVLYIACNGTHVAVSSKEIAGMQDLPPRYLEQLMQRLVHAGILRGMRGPKGGYVLARERRRITVADICNALHDEEDNEKPTATPLVTNVIWPVMDKVRASLMVELGKVTLADLRDRTITLKLSRREEHADFNI